MSRSSLSAERGLRASLRSSLLIGLVALAAVACGGPTGSTSAAAPSASARGGVFTPEPGVSAAAGVPERSAALTRIGGVDLEVVDFSVEEALGAEGGDTVSAMLADLGIVAGDVELSVAVAPGGDPAISDWLLPGVSADDILGAWKAAAPGEWGSATLDGLAALEGSGPDGTRAWAFALDERFVYVRTEEKSIATEVAAAID